MNSDGSTLRAEPAEQLGELWGEDPLFVRYDWSPGGSYAQLNYRLRETSPAVDSGISLAAVGNDFDGVARPQGPAHDLGAFEHVADSCVPQTCAELERDCGQWPDGCGSIMDCGSCGNGGAGVGGSGGAPEGSGGMEPAAGGSGGSVSGAAGTATGGVGGSASPVGAAGAGGSSALEAGSGGSSSEASSGSRGCGCRVADSTPNTPFVFLSLLLGWIWRRFE